MIGRPQDRHIPRAQRHHRAGNADAVKDHANNVTSDVRFLHLMYVSPQTCSSTGCGHPEDALSIHAYRQIGSYISRTTRTLDVTSALTFLRRSAGSRTTSRLPRGG